MTFLIYVCLIKLSKTLWESNNAIGVQMRWELFDFLGHREEQTGFFCLFLPPCYSQKSDSTYCSSKIFLKVSLFRPLILTSVDSPLLSHLLLKYLDFYKTKQFSTKGFSNFSFFLSLFYFWL